MAKNQGSMLPNNSTPTTPKSETECDVTDDQENAHLEVEETETNIENSDEKSTGKFKQFTKNSLQKNTFSEVDNFLVKFDFFSWRVIFSSRANLPFISGTLKNHT